MEGATGLTADPKVKRVVTPEDLLTLATFCDRHAAAVSFGFGHVAVPDTAHREELRAIKRLIQEAVATIPEPLPECLSKDLEHILAVAEEVRLNPARLRLVFACREQSVWEEFDLPATELLSFLQVGRHFRLAPLMLSLQSTAPYCVAILESGKARVFVVRGTEIQEVTARLAIEEQRSEENDPRVGWSKHVGKSRMQHERGYFKNLSHQLLQLISEQRATGLIVGCHQDLMG